MSAARSAVDPLRESRGLLQVGLCRRRKPPSQKIHGADVVQRGCLADRFRTSRCTCSAALNWISASSYWLPRGEVTAQVVEHVPDALLVANLPSQLQRFSIVFQRRPAPRHSSCICAMVCTLSAMPASRPSRRSISNDSCAYRSRFAGLVHGADSSQPNVRSTLARASSLPRWIGHRLSATEIIQRVVPLAAPDLHLAAPSSASMYFGSRERAGQTVARVLVRARCPCTRLASAYCTSSLPGIILSRFSYTRWLWHRRAESATRFARIRYFSCWREGHRSVLDRLARG